MSSRFAFCRKSQVTLNGKATKVKNFKDYVNLYIKDDEAKAKISEKINDRYFARFQLGNQCLPN